MPASPFLEECEALIVHVTGVMNFSHVTERQQDHAFQAQFLLFDSNFSSNYILKNQANTYKTWSRNSDHIPS